MSKAASSTGAQDLEMGYQALINKFEAVFAEYSSTDPAKRREQLQVLLRRFVEFKERLERQSDLYQFEWVPSECPFIEGKMKSFTGICAPDAVVQKSLCPVLYKIPPEGELVLVEKAVVKLCEQYPEPEPHVTQENKEQGARLDLDDISKMDFTLDSDSLGDSESLLLLI
ncbi:hypothetical protein N7456_001228 [Penicillium angulare]|uniref:Uncharacterized protein n=1 Tax=Penicillium angulare TaxID=116970 RepID=A0A9W9GDY3_9EURO|nr:hypothetical protein N7456_001228 [Penicillium angulare]